MNISNSRANNLAKNFQISHSTFLFHILLVVSFCFLIALVLHNFDSYPPCMSFDAPGHIEYLELLKTNFRVPLANEGWELYQPPLYYALHFWLPNLKLVQFAGVIWWITISAVAMATFRLLFKDHFVAASGALFVASLPVVLYLTPAIGNEFFSTVLISVGFFLYTRFTKKPTNTRMIALGIVLGLALLAKATALVLVAAIVADVLLQKLLKNSTLTLKHLIAIVCITIGISGWFYARNVFVFGNPFQSSIDFPQFHIVQEPGYRDLNFFIDLSGFWNMDLFRAHWYSLIPGTYFSFFYDGHNAIIPVQAYSLAGILLVLASLPFVTLIGLGLARSLKNLRMQEARIFSIYLVLLLTAYIAYNVKLPFYSTVKGAFVASLALPLGYFLVSSLRRLPTKFQRLFVLYQLGYVVLVVKNFWILPHWF